MDLRELGARNTLVNNRHPWELARLEVTTDILKNNDLLASKTFLDLGCGDSFFINTLYNQNQLNATCFGVDINFEDPMILEFNKENPKIQFFKTLDNLADNFKGTIDVVFLMDVIEHIEDDIAFLKMVAQYSFITPQTTFVITVPAFQSLFASHDVFLGHYRRYDNQLLENNISKSGYKTFEVGYFFSLLLLPRWIQMLKEKLVKPKETTGLVEWQGSGFKTKTIANILYLDYKFSKIARKIGIKLPGLSNYALCRPLEL